MESVFDGLLDFDVDKIIADAIDGEAIPDFLRNLAADAKLARKDWDEVQRRKEQQARIAEVRLCWVVFADGDTNQLSQQP